ncbi:ribonuclease HII [Spirulina sp. CS-785/01]|uniref:ribonuclease HII n=1 Tax=Spirulina sp. CS-785/01 TaxID=3021716 RepID=UPI00232D85CF|nr:ribonuclease HII [Spirulina sp. CS-785/01]MDB9314066.1 ribonuclease HII [Spirulina sp. CS-785/01]
MVKGKTSQGQPLAPGLLYADKVVAGVDEVGRGAWFGPVVAAAVILPLSAYEELAALRIRESKRLSGKRRKVLEGEIRAVAVDVQVGWAEAAEIDQVNILQASLRAMERAVSALQPQPELCLIDGRFGLPNIALEQETLVKGDATSLVIAAASIVAKVWRDELIIRWSEDYPQYQLASNKGYGTKAHRLAIEQYGVSPQHRRSFRPCNLGNG